MDDKIIYKRCERKEYPEFLDMVNTAFDYGAGNEWFQKNLAHCTPYENFALDIEIEKHFIAKTNGKVIGAVGAYPTELIVSEDDPNGEIVSIKAVGIGQVSCLKEYRGRGVMSALLTMAITKNLQGGALLAFLSGDRFRYGVHGFDFGGNVMEFSIHKRRFSKFTDTAELSIKNVSYSDVKILQELHENYPSYIKRDKRDWEKQLSRTGSEWLLGEKEGKKAYFCVDSKNNVLEVQGDMNTAKSLILWHMETSSPDEIIVTYPQMHYKRDTISGMLWQTSMDAIHKPSDLISICAPEKLLAMLTPVLIHQGYGHFLSILDEKGKLLLLKALFGFGGCPFPEELRNFQGIRPLIFWIPPVDNI